MIASNKVIKLRKDLPSGTIILNRPERRNAINRETINALIEAFDDFQQERKVRALILTGSGTAFCSGTDLREMNETRNEDNALEIWHNEVMLFQDLIERMLRFPKPIICAVNGPVMGSGLALVLASDLVIATKSSKFGLPEGKRGLVAGLTAPLMAFRIGVGNAASMLFTGEDVSVATAQQIGLVNKVVNDDLIWASAQELAKSCASNAIQTMQMTKHLLNETVGETLFTQLSIGSANMATARTTDAAMEGVEAFLEKRVMKWD